MRIYSARGNSSRTYLYGFLARAGQAVQPGEFVLDAGAGRAPYRSLFAHAVYETADFLGVKGKKYAEPDYVCDLAEIPVCDARFDHVVLTQVLEHLPEPAKVLAELQSRSKSAEAACGLPRRSSMPSTSGLMTSTAIPSSACATYWKTRVLRYWRSTGWRATSAR